MNRSWVQLYSGLFALALLTSQVWSWFAAPHMDQPIPTDTEEEANIDQSRDAALLFKLLTPVTSDDLPLCTQQLPENSKNSHKRLAWTWSLPAPYRYTALPLPINVQLPQQLYSLWCTATSVLMDSDPTRGPPVWA